jgi:DNA-binding transcriptional LysR family regulator
MDRLASMTAFTKVVESGGFSAASRRLNMSVTMVSNHIQALEEHLAVRLLNRTTRKVSLTEAGRAYYERCIQILAEVAEAEETVGELQSTPRGVLRLNIAQAVVSVIGQVIAAYVGRYPSVSVDMTMTDRMVDMVEEGYDLAVRVTPVPDSNLIVRRLASFRHVLCASPAYLARHDEPKSPQDIAAHNCLSYQYYPYGQDWHFVSGSTELSVRASGNFRCNSAVALVQAAVSGLGLFLGPSFMVAAEIKAGRLVPLLGDYLPVEFEVCALYPHRRHLSAKVRAFIDLLAEQFTLLA